MNKTEAIMKINKMGKIGAVICLIGKIILGIATFGVLAASIALFILPKDFVTVSSTTTIDTEVNLTSFTKNMSSEELQKMQNSFDNMPAGVNGSISSDNKNFDVEKLEYNNGKLSVVTDADIQSYSLGSIRPVLLVALVSIACSFAAIFFAGSLCKAFEKCVSPFENDIIVKMRRLAYSLIPMAVLSFFADGLVNAIFNGGRNLTFSVNFSVVFAILIILAISYIFKYGAQLQEESDETL